ncbi:hypothetical protein Tco_0700438 [Tanacetum coccineum]
MFDEYFNPLTIADPLVQEAAAPQAEDQADSSMSTSIDQDAPSTKAGFVFEESFALVARLKARKDFFLAYADHLEHGCVPNGCISQSPRGIFLNQSKYALESLKKYGFESGDPVDTSMVEKS